MRRANLTVPEKLKMQREGYKFFCERHKIDRCAIGDDIGFTCFRASKHKTREGCQYWKPIHIKREDEILRLRADLAAVTEERDALLALLAPVDDDILREIAARHVAGIDGHSDDWDRYVDEAKDYIDAIRPHIEAAERERCAKIAEHLSGWGSDFGKGGHAMHIASAIRSRK